MRKLHFFSILVALLFATTNLWALPTGVVNGKLLHKFSIGCTDQVYFSQGNLQYQASTNTWRFAENQYNACGGSNGTGNKVPYRNTGSGNQTAAASRSTQANWIDLFGWGTSGYHDPSDTYNLYYQPWESTYNNKVSADYNTYGYGPSTNVLPVNHSLSEYPATKNYDWGVYNAISNGGNSAGLWRTLTGPEWDFLIYGRSNASNLRGSATIWNTDSNAVIGVGLILLPDDWVKPSDCAFSSVTTDGYGTNNYQVDAGWAKMEEAGAVFLPAAGGRFFIPGTQVDDAGQYGRYHSSTRTNAGANTVFGFGPNGVSVSSDGGWRGFSVRLVQDVPDGEEPSRPIASITNPPTPESNLTFNNSYQYLVKNDGTAIGGAIWYRYKKTSDENYSSWLNYRPNVKNAGDYLVQYKVVGEGCYDDSEVETILETITIKRAATSMPSPMPQVDEATLTYNGTAQDLVILSGTPLSSSNTMMYSTDGTTWSSTIPQGTNAGNYTVYYKVYVGENNEYIPTPPSNELHATIAKADLVVDLPASTSTIPYDGTEKTLLNIGAVVGGTVYYSNSPEGPWSETTPKATDPDDYNVYYKIVPDDTDNYNTIGPNQVVVTISDPYPFITDQTADDATIASILTGLTDPWQLKVKRTIYADGEYNTICLPFALDKDALDASPLAGFNNLKTIKGASVTGSGQALSIDIFVEDVDHMEAGKPYLISYPSAHADIENPVFQLSSTTSYELHAGSITADGVTFQGMFAQVHIDPYTNERDRDYLFLGANSQLMWPLASETSSDVKMRGFRAYFIIDRNAIPAQVAPRGTHARFVNAPKQPTAIENTELNTKVQKLLENGQLIILKNGIKYNAQGQVLK